MEALDAAKKKLLEIELKGGMGVLPTIEKISEALAMLTKEE